ncbi:hypothetical protein RND81_10G168400 [Saponaria officinalis]|uniref:Neprosin PEP catalytic domain-containing protein n=1 Tax=Saponaria officinalis TaxID=3572 RepID=A0AAW1I5I1_SAPOF
MRDKMFFDNNWRIIVGFLTLAMFIAADITQGKGVFLNYDGKIKVMQKPVKSIQSSDGDIIDCVDIYHQPAFYHPALQNHTIQMMPSFRLKQDAVSDRSESSSVKMLQQTWQKSGSCPKGTVPIRRVRSRDLLRFDNLERFGKKSPSIAANSSNNRQFYPDHTLVVNDNKTIINLGPRPNHSSAVLVSTVVHYAGSVGTIAVYNPPVERWDEYSTAQLWVQNGSPQDLESVESGWIVHKKLYGDTRTRFFTYWTRDGSQKTGCFDHVCAGFVQTNPDVTLGAAFNDISIPGRSLYFFTLRIEKDTRTENWWLTMNRDIQIGYWPATLFSRAFGQGATILQWGGEVFSANIRKTPHTTTAMGSGRYIDNDRGHTCFVENIRVLQNPLGPWSYPNPSYIGTYADEKQCYAAYLDYPAFMKQQIFFFGGPGRNPQCP